MASDDYPIRITAPEYKPAGQSDLATWLAKEALAAQSGVKPEDNEGASTVAYGELYEPPVGATKPEKDPKGLPFPQATTNYATAQNERREAIGNAYATTPAASAADRALMGANFDHVRNGDFESHSPLLSGQVARLGIGK